MRCFCLQNFDLIRFDSNSALFLFWFFWKLVSLSMTSVFGGFIHDFYIILSWSSLFSWHHRDRDTNRKLFGLKLCGEFVYGWRGWWVISIIGFDWIGFSHFRYFVFFYYFISNFIYLVQFILFIFLLEQFVKYISI